MPPVATKSKYGKIFKSYIFTPLHPMGVCDVSKVWVILRRKYCPSLVTLSPLKLKILHFVVRRNYGQTKRRTDRQSDSNMPPTDLSSKEHKNRPRIITQEWQNSKECMCHLWNKATELPRKCDYQTDTWRDGQTDTHRTNCLIAKGPTSHLLADFFFMTSQSKDPSNNCAIVMSK